MKYVLILATLLATSYVVEANGGANAGIESLRNRLAGKFTPRVGYRGQGASAAASVGGNGRNLHAASSASAGDQYGSYHYQAPPAPVYAHPYAAPSAQYRQPEPAYAPYQSPAVNPYEEQEYYQEEPPRPHHQPSRRHYPSAGPQANAASSAYGPGSRAAASASSPAYANPPSTAPREHAPPAPPSKPSIGLDSFKGRNSALNHGRGGPRFGRYGGSSAHAAAGNGAASAAAATNGANSYSASAGTYANDGFGRESGSYRRQTSSADIVENGKADDNHYYKAGSYGKAADENLYEAYNKDNDDIEQTDNVYRRKKRGENYVLSYNKADRESGSDVLAKDRHSSHFAKNVKKFNENVDQKYKKEGNGIVETQSFANTHQIDDEDEDAFDSDGFGKANSEPAKPAIQTSAPTTLSSASSSVSNGVASSAASAVGSSH